MPFQHDLRGWDYLSIRFYPMLFFPNPTIRTHREHRNIRRQIIIVMEFTAIFVNLQPLQLFNIVGGNKQLYFMFLLPAAVALSPSNHSLKQNNLLSWRSILVHWTACFRAKQKINLLLALHTV